MKIIKRGCFLGIALAAFASLKGTAANIPLFASQGWYRHFQLFGLGAYDSKLGDVVTGEVVWAPQFGLGKRFYTHAHIGGSLFKLAAISTLFPVINLQLFLGAYLKERLPLFLEIGGGEQIWLVGSSSNQAPVLSANVGFPLRLAIKKISSDRLILGVSNFLWSLGHVWEGRIGLGIMF